MIDMVISNKYKELIEKRRELNCAGVATESIAKHGASEDEINSISAELFSKMPSDYIEFLRHSNGAKLFDNETSGIMFLGTNEIDIETNYAREIYEEDWDDSVIIFGVILGCGDLVGFKGNSSEYVILDVCMGDAPSYWGEISNSFWEFLDLIIEHRNDRYWLDLERS